MQKICAEVPPHFRSKKIYNKQFWEKEKYFLHQVQNFHLFCCLGSPVRPTFIDRVHHVQLRCCCFHHKLYFRLRLVVWPWDVKRDGKKTISSGTWWGKKTAALSLPSWRMSAENLMDSFKKISIDSFEDFLVDQDRQFQNSPNFRIDSFRFFWTYICLGVQ